VGRHTNKGDLQPIMSQFLSPRFIALGRFPMYASSVVKYIRPWEVVLASLKMLG
jgi:hypothetical protein